METLERMSWGKERVFNQLFLLCPRRPTQVHMSRRVSGLRYRAWSLRPHSTLCAKFTVMSSGGRSKWSDLARGQWYDPEAVHGERSPRGRQP